MKLKLEWKIQRAFVKRRSFAVSRVLHDIIRQEINRLMANVIHDVLTKKQYFNKV